MTIRERGGMVVTAVALILLLAFPAKAQDTLTPEQKTAIEKLIREYLIANPEVLVEAAQALEKRQAAEEKIAQKQRVVANTAALFASADDFVHNPDGRIPMVEFFDYQCGYCKRVLPAIQRLRAEIPDVRMIYKEYPILGPVSEYAARAAIASRRQGKYLRFHDLLMGFRGRLSERAVLEVAARAELDVAELETDMKAPEVKAVIEANIALGLTMQVRGTPAMFIGETYVPGAIPYAKMVAIVAATRENCTVC